MDLVSRLSMVIAVINLYLVSHLSIAFAAIDEFWGTYRVIAVNNGVL